MMAFDRLSPLNTVDPTVGTAVARQNRITMGSIASHRTIIQATADLIRSDMRGGLVLPHSSRVPAGHVILGSHAVLLPPTSHISHYNHVKVPLPCRYIPTSF